MSGAQVPGRSEQSRVRVLPDHMKDSCPHGSAHGAGLVLLSAARVQLRQLPPRQHGGVQAAQQGRGDASDPNEGEEGLSSSAGTRAHRADAQAPPPAGPGGGTFPSKAGPSDLLTGRFLTL